MGYEQAGMNLRGMNKLVLPHVNTTHYGIKSVVYTATKAWNSLPDDYRTMTSLKSFNAVVWKLSL